MISLALKKKNAVLLFGVGFLIGIVLEIVLVQRGIFLAVYYNIGRPSGKFWKSGFRVNASAKVKIEDAAAAKDRSENSECFSDANRNPRVACMVILKHPQLENLETAEKTWLRNCDEFFAVRVKRAGVGGNVEDVPDEGEACERTRIVNVTSKSAWGGLCKALLSTNSSDCEWFMISPDNLMVLVENLKKFVSQLDWNDGHYFGHAIGHFEADYNALSAGVLISRSAREKLLGKFTSAEECEVSGKYWRNEDLYLGKYLKQFDILPKDTRDQEGRGRFHGYSINVLLHPGKLYKQSDYSRKAVYPAPEGLNCCSPDLITIDATNSIRMFHHYYYIYKLGITNEPTRMAENAGGDGFDWREFLRGEGYDESAIEKMTADEYYKVWASKIPPESLYEMMREEFGS